MEIDITRAPKRVFTLAERGWKVLNEEEQEKITKALANPIRSYIFKELRAGPIRQIELAERIGEIFGRKYCQTLLRHHLKQLKEAGLIEFDTNPKVPLKAKIIYKTMDVRMMARLIEKPAPHIPKRVPRTREELEEELERVLKG